jgi:methyltransferase (TIGR00027 family)
MGVSQPVARTAFYCCVLRADDAASARPVCGDAYAARFFDENIRRDMEPAVRLKAPNRSNVARHRLIDDLVRDQLVRDPHTRIILLGAGFDTRAFRFTGGRYFELDDPQLLAYKEARLPARDAPNPLTRIPVTFATTPAEDFLRPLAGDDQAMVVLEGVSMYLSDAALADLASALTRALPRATLVCDLMSQRFSETYSRKLRTALSALGAEFGQRSRPASEPFLRAGYRPRHRYSIVERARQAGTMPIPRWILGTLLRELRDGYQVWVWDPPEAKNLQSAIANR